MTKKNYKLLQNLYKNKISKELSLTEAERAAGVAAAKAHYKLLADSGNKYGNLALEVVNNNGEWGKMANKHLEHQAVFEGINELAVPTVRDNIIISLAHMDIIARKGDNIQNDLKAIGIYHKEVFRRQISEYAWGGLLFEEIKTGLWMDIYIKNEGRHDLASAVMQTTKEASKALSSGRLKTEYSIERMTQTMLYTAGRASGNNFTGNSTSFSKEGVAKSWGVDVSQVVLLDPYVGVHNAVVPFSKFIIKPANPLISKPTSSVIATPAPVVAESSEEQKTEHKQSSDLENNKISEDLVLRLNMLFSTPQSQSNSSSSLTPQVNSFSDFSHH